jgi:hypothetical protein
MVDDAGGPDEEVQDKDPAVSLSSRRGTVVRGVLARPCELWTKGVEWTRGAAISPHHIYLRPDATSMSW